MEPLQSIGASVPRRESPRLVRGAGSFVDDIALPGTLTLAFVRSPHAHARVLRIDTRAAAELSGVHGVVTAADLGPAGGPLMLMVASPKPRHAVAQRPLAVDRVCYQGEAVAAVLADDRYTAEDGAEAVLVEYEALPVVGDPRHALNAAAPLLHPGCADNEVGSWRMQVGDAARAFAQAHTTVDLEVEIGRAAGQPMETRGVLVAYDARHDLLTVWTSTQVPHRIRTGIAEALGRPEESIRVIAPDVGGAFGSKLCLYPEEVVCAFLALQAGRPVKWTEDRREHFLTTAHGRGQVHRIALALDEQGRILALKDRFVHDNGAYCPYGIRVPMVTCKALMGPYRIPNYDVAFTSVFTNRAPVIPYRGAGQPEAVFALERALDRAALGLGLEPAELRRRNLIPPEAYPHDTGLVYPGLGPVVYDSGNVPAALDRVLQAIDLPAFRAEQAAARAQGRYQGFGLGCYVEETGTGSYEGAVVRVDNTGTVTVMAAICAQGQGHETMLAQVVSATLGVPAEQIRVRLGDTDLMPYGVGTWGSRAAVMAGTVVGMAAEQVRRKAIRLAARLLEADPADIRWGDGGAHVAGTPQRRISLAELARASAAGRGPLLLPEPPGLEATHYFAPSAMTYASGVHGAIVEVDGQTGQVFLRRYVVVHDCGRVLNPDSVDGQVQGGVAQGVAGSLLEELVYDAAGQLLTGSFMDYLLPTACEVPPVEIHHQETLSPLNPYGIKGAGEGGTIPAYAAVVGAVEDALRHRGVALTATPVTPPQLQRALAGPPGGARSG